jgi:hypothetical protein
VVDCLTVTEFSAQERYNSEMRYLLVFLFFVCIVLWVERYYWKRRAHLIEQRLLGVDRAEAVKGLFDAWLDGRIEAQIRKKRNR